MQPATVDVVTVREVGPDTIAVILETPDEFDALPGQFVKLSATVDGEPISRFYTLSSADVEGTFELTVAVDPDGTLGPWLTEATGRSVTVEGPYGTAYYEAEPRILILAGGPGVGPAIGIGERAVDEGNDVAIVYRDETPVHRDRLDRLRDRRADVIVTDGPIDAAVGDHIDDRQVYVYGFQEFVSDAVSAIEAAGGDPDDAKVESFG